MDLLNKTKHWTGFCPDLQCKRQIYFMESQNEVTCHGCGQNHTPVELNNMEEVENISEIPQMVYDYMLKVLNPEIGSEFIKVNGLSNFHCKMLSPLLTYYGMDKAGIAKPLNELGHSHVIECGKVLGPRAFHISPNHLGINGYGKDQSGSTSYLGDLLECLKESHQNEERIVPIHADGDGHCLVHALSRALIGRELFWHGLRINLQDHLTKNLKSYVELFKDFHEPSEWEHIVKEADPDSVDSGFTVGLGNIHLFALCNILRRPVMLLDSLQKVHNAGDYSGLFVPVLCDPSACVSKSPVCVAWSGAGHNHFVPLVPVAGRALPDIPAHLLPRVWGVDRRVAADYLRYNDDGSVRVGEGKPLNCRYLQKLARAMEILFFDKHQIEVALVADVYRHHLLPRPVPLRHDDVIAIARLAAVENRIFRCLTCGWLTVLETVRPDMLLPGGELYRLLLECHTAPKPDKLYSFPVHRVRCLYDQSSDRLMLVSCACKKCSSDKTRTVSARGITKYENGDATTTPTRVPTKCGCGKKHYWDGREYDNFPETLPLTIEWDSTSVQTQVTWFFGDSDVEMNSSPDREARAIAGDKFPAAVAGDEQLISRIRYAIVDALLERNLPVMGGFYDRGDLSSRDHSATVVTSHEARAGGSDDARCAAGDSDVTCGSKVEREGSSTAIKRKEVSKTRERVEKSAKVDDDSAIVVKVILSDGRTSTFSLATTTPTELRAAICARFAVDGDVLLKRGFPPTPLDPAVDRLRSGDTVRVEIIAAKRDDDLATRLRDLDRSRGVATMWEYALSHPELFQRGGAFYDQFGADIGLVADRHCKLPALPDKTLTYNATFDRVELCLEPLGHFAIDRDVVGHMERARNLAGGGLRGRPAPGYRVLHAGAPQAVSSAEVERERERLLSVIRDLRGRETKSE